MLAEFTSAVNAVRCAVEIQDELKIRNDELPENQKMGFRIGVNLGDVIVEGEKIYGDGVNIVPRIGDFGAQWLAYASPANASPCHYWPSTHSPGP